MTIEEVVKQMLSDQTELPPNSINLTDRLIDNLGMDSLDIVEVSMNLEQALDIDIPDSSVGEIQTVQDLIDAIARLKNAMGG
jgi:acyl carrier protein